MSVPSNYEKFADKLNKLTNNTFEFVLERVEKSPNYNGLLLPFIAFFEGIYDDTPYVIMLTRFDFRTFILDNEGKLLPFEKASIWEELFYQKP